jgi:L-threonate 2-dehydrogenase
MKAQRPKGIVGVIGLGIMGGAFARNLAADGFRVIGYDIDRARTRAATRAGVEIVGGASDVARAAPTIITSLPHPDALAATVAAIGQHSPKPRVVIETSTFALADKLKAARALKAAGHTMLDCPISGTGAQAATKDIVVYASGETQAIKRARPIFSGLARALYDLGALGNGSRMKYVANLLVAINNVAAAEAMVLGMKSGLAPQVIYDMVRSGAGNSRIFELRAPMMVKNSYEQATMKVSVWQKDMAVIGEFAKALRCPTPLFAATRAIYDAALASGHAADDTASVCAVMEKRAGVRRKGRVHLPRKTR